MTENLVTPETIEAFRSNGACVLRGYFKDWVETLRAGIARNMAEPSADVKIYQGQNGSGRFFGDYCNWDRIPEYKDFIVHSKAAAIGRELMGSKTVRRLAAQQLNDQDSTGTRANSRSPERNAG